MWKLKRLAGALRGALAAPLLMIFGGADIGWAGAFAPMIVGEGTLNELRNLAGPPSYPGQKNVIVNLVTGEFKWQTRSQGHRRTYSSRRRGKR